MVLITVNLQQSVFEINIVLFSIGAKSSLKLQINCLITSRRKQSSSVIAKPLCSAIPEFSTS